MQMTAVDLLCCTSCRAGLFIRLPLCRDAFASDRFFIVNVQ